MFTFVSGSWLLHTTRVQSVSWKELLRKGLSNYNGKTRPMNYQSKNSNTEDFPFFPVTSNVRALSKGGDLYVLVFYFYLKVFVKHI